MIEIPEAFHISRQITQHLAGKKIAASHVAASPHKFAWYQGDPSGYPALFNGKTIQSAKAVGGMIEIQLDGVLIVLSEGAYPHLYENGTKLPSKHQLLLQFIDGEFLAVSVRMYGGILAFREGMVDNAYYLLAKEKPSPLSEKFDRAYFEVLMGSEDIERLSAKALLATEQRIPGLGNGTLQEVLYEVGIHPKSRMSDIAPEIRDGLFKSIKQVIKEIADGGGRNTEVDLFGQAGAYQMRCSRLTVGQPCPVCGDRIQKASYMGGSIYFCPTCQPL